MPMLSMLLWFWKFDEGGWWAGWVSIGRIEVWREGVYVRVWLWKRLYSLRKTWCLVDDGRRGSVYVIIDYEDVRQSTIAYRSSVGEEEAGSKC